MDNRRLFLAAFLSLGLVILWGRFVQRPPVGSPAEAIPTASPIASDSPVQGALSVGSPAEAGAGETEGVATGEAVSAPELSDVIALVKEAVVVDTERFRAEFSNEGAELSSFRLKKELDSEGAPLELVRQRGAGDVYPFALVDLAGEAILGDALFTVERSSTGDGGETVLFTHRSGGKGAVKRFTLQASGLIDVDVSVEGILDWQVVIGPGVRDLSAEERKNRFRQPKTGYRLAGDVERVGPEKQREDLVLPAQGLDWVTLEDNYFLVAVVPGAGTSSVTVRPLRERETYDAGASRFVSVLEAELGNEDGLLSEQELLVSATGDSLQLVGFFGSKRYQDLASLPYGLQETVRWGFFGVLARPLYYGLAWIYQRVPNYGWAIVIMTFVIKLVFFPLTHKGQKSMAKMQELSPKIQAIRTRFRPKLKDKHGRPNRDAQHKMNEELLGLYRKEGVNPAGGCLPMVIQIPVFFAFFRLLQSAVELRNAPWLGWVTDLSAPDPWLVLPAMMLATSLLLQRVTPAPPDPMQRRIIQMMPIVFSAVSITFPAGLVLYWTTNNVLTMIQQWFYYRSRGQSATPAVAKSSGGALGSEKSSSQRNGQAK